MATCHLERCFFKSIPRPAENCCQIVLEKMNYGQHEHSLFVRTIFLSTFMQYCCSNQKPTNKMVYDCSSYMTDISFPIPTASFRIVVLFFSIMDKYLPLNWRSIKPDSVSKLQLHSSFSGFFWGGGGDLELWVLFFLLVLYIIMLIDEMTPRSLLIHLWTLAHTGKALHNKSLLIWDPWIYVEINCRCGMTILYLFVENNQEVNYHTWL